MGVLGRTGASQESGWKLLEKPSENSQQQGPHCAG